MSIPLVQNNEKDSINTSIIAIKKNIERINSILGLVDSGSDIDTSEFVKKSDIVDVVQSGNMNPVTSNAVATSNAMPVDTVTSGNMHSVTSNAVSTLLKKYTYTISSVTLSERSYDEFSISTSNLPISVNGYTVISYMVQQGNKDAMLYNLRVRDNQWKLTIFNSATVSQTVNNITINVYFYKNT